ncbi:hypothetical protein EMIHUDRAFT_446964 [Emiliania huxleyi CCMP1516]|uniref:TLC domain-containing protein n=2 Tax=Emiliania huxleyi TaxID=2903 RepID=A0A0D3KNY1_EMIH1|nr:hypothetical protein EMIHUDRAFT_437919 [Emiliania huxleyi CCMP1516]XP_005789895.1 hypothetical protein EMIHUDRAFT_446964 [Emiliania huxleyi CCMP1516]EOD10254.1 hypothetical protein EMIHUDRAFT_437919 [Emiliania huxleyi CCMP1516]EOD37466.1 hypothetical protein EMIHUDRAFT_446964 [Emiliania huxleyi CCMP1516]|eukprot:XP_005762683.1 hypothetical protein EMIHUDRAFT_437919 [Emiliania huxleyi CCMP1516]
MWTQIMVLPAIFLLSLACANYSISGWVDTASSTWFTANGQRFWDWCFFYVFGGYMVEDLIVFRLGPMLLLHHIGCLAGLMFAFVVCPAGWPYFSAGAVAFEFGSALLNLYCLYPHSRYVLWAYASSMTCSNAAAGLCCAAMVLSQPSAAIGAKAFSATLTGTFILLRQKTCNDYVRKHRRAARARRKEGGGGHQRRRRWLSLPWRRAPSAACKST